MRDRIRKILTYLLFHEYIKKEQITYFSKPVRLFLFNSVNFGIPSLGSRLFAFYCFCQENAIDKKCGVGNNIFI